MAERQATSESRVESWEAAAKELELVINTIPALAWSATPDGMLDFSNQQLRDYVGLTSEEILGDRFFRIFHPDDTPRMAEAWREILASKQSREVEARIMGADGVYRWFTLRQNPLMGPDRAVLKWYGVLLNIEDRKRTENALKASEIALAASERNLRVFLDSLPVLAWSARPDGSADFVNRRWVEFAGASSEEILEWGFLKFYHPDDVEGMVQIWTHALASGSQIQLKGRIRSANGQYRWFLFAGQKITDANGVVRWVGANVDIDDLVEAEQQLQQSQTELAHVTRITTMGELTISIAHEISQPLMAIVVNAGTCVRWLDEDQFNPGQARRAAERIVADGHRAGDIIASIRSLARKAPPRMERLGAYEVVKEVVALLAGEILRRDLDVATDFPGVPLLVLGDRIQIQQVLVNLIMNAAEAMEESVPECRRLIVSGFVDRGDFARISVTDKGVGLSDDTIGRAFDAFFSTKSGGIGMGLSICRSIVEAHGGRIWASQNKPQGSIFSFTLPLAEV